MNGPVSPIPSLDALAADPAKAAGLSPDMARQYLFRLSAILPALLAVQASASTSQVDDALLTVSEAAAKLKLSKDRVYELVRQGELKKIGSGRRVLIHPADLAEYIARHRA